MKSIAIIPARMASTRFPGKPLALLHGLPMIEHVRRRVALSPLFSAVVVATCDDEIADVVRKSGGQVAMTADTHERCTDRIAEAAAGLEGDIIVNVQGDEPLVRPEMLEPLVRTLQEDDTIPCSNLMVEIQTDADFKSSNVVKTVVDGQLNALYFSREPIPTAAKSDVRTPRFQQLGIIAFRRDFLFTFGELEPTPLEVAESVDMLRAVEHGYTVRMVPCPFKSIGVDVPGDMARAEALLDEDDLLQVYASGLEGEG
jgi:3-deoxy-manno-octulosonate cytidylyltransferase (CMP-KDO synthetase)